MLMAGAWIKRHLFGRRRKVQRAPLPYRRSLAVELLEDRVCPSLPIVTSIAPSAGPVAGGTKVAISGTNLAAATAVKFGSSSASITSGSDTLIIALSPAGTSTVDVTVTTADGTSATVAGDQFTYLQTPAAVSPSGAIVTAPLGALAQHLAALSDRVARLPGGEQLGQFRAQLAGQLGFDPLTRDGLLSAGLDPDRGAAIALFEARPRPEWAVALPLTKPDLFAQTVQRLLVERFGASPGAGSVNTPGRRCSSALPEINTTRSPGGSNDSGAGVTTAAGSFGRDSYTARPVRASRIST